MDIDSLDGDSQRQPRRHPWWHGLVAGVVMLAVLWCVPGWWCARQAAAWYTGDDATQNALGAGVASWVHRDLAADAFSTGSARFDGEWLFGTYVMAGMGFCQLAIEDPVHRDRYLAHAEACIEALLDEPAQAFDIDAWGTGPIDSLDDPTQHHAAYLGYFNLLLSLHRYVDPDSRFAPLNDQITTALVDRLWASGELMLLQTYPGEMYPVDNCAVIASIGMHGKATGADHGPLVARWVRTCEARYVDPASGLLIQAVDYRNGDAVDAPRGSGTALGLYFLSFIDGEMSARLYEAMRRRLAVDLAGFAAMCEYDPASPGGVGDIDSGPVVFGLGLSATGFSLAGARAHGDVDGFRRLYATTHLFGVPHDPEGGSQFVVGGPVGNAILFAMLTAQAPDRYTSVTSRQEGP